MKKGEPHLFWTFWLKYQSKVTSFSAETGNFWAFKENAYPFYLPSIPLDKIYLAEPSQANKSKSSKQMSLTSCIFTLKGLEKKSVFF